MQRTSFARLVGFLVLVIALASTSFAADADYRNAIIQGKKALQQRDFGQAYACFDAAVALASCRELGDRAAGRAVYYLAVTLARQGRPVSAERMMRGALGLLVAHFGPDHRLLAPVYERLARLAKRNGRPDEARRLLSVARAIRTVPTD